jgi:MraZ protein
MFRGVNLLQLDDKGRLTIPARHRDSLKVESDGQVVVTIDTEERCLLLYPLPDWEMIERKIEALPSFNPAARRIQRLLIGHATEVELDTHGRLLLPPVLREYAGLQKSIVLIGQGKKFEIWDEERWNQGRESWLSQGLSATENMPLDLQSLSL